MWTNDIVHICTCIYACMLIYNDIVYVCKYTCTYVGASISEDKMRGFWKLVWTNDVAFMKMGGVSGLVYG